MADEFAWHSAALGGTRGPISADEPESGFYRQKRQDGSYEPVAYWKDSGTGEQRCHINGKSPQDPLRMYEAWPYASKNPVSAEAYWHRMNTGQWLDNDAGAGAAKGPEIDPGANGQNAEESLKLEIAKAVEGAKAYETIDSDEAAARAQTLRSALTSFKGDAQKKYESWSRPLLDEIETIRKTWFPIRDNAAAAADRIRIAMGRWEDIKRENARRAAEEAAKIEKRQADAFQAATDRAIAANKPPPEPPKPAPVVASNTPPPASKIKGASGRAASVTMANIITDIDLDKCFAKFRTAPELRELFMALADKSMKAGICTAEDIGAIIEQKSVIR